MRLIKDWIVAERQNAVALGGTVGAGTDWEGQSLPLTVSEIYRAKFAAFSTYFKSESQAIADDTLSQEVTVLDKLAQ